MKDPRQEWQGDTRVFLVIAPDDGQNTGIDLDEPGWSATHSSLMRAPGSWVLFDKAGHARLRLIVHEGEQPFYTARHVGVAGSAGNAEITAYGLGKKLLDNTTTSCWLLPDGSVCGEEDLNIIGIAMAKQQPLRPNV